MLLEHNLNEVYNFMNGVEPTCQQNLNELSLYMEGKID